MSKSKIQELAEIVAADQTKTYEYLDKVFAFIAQLCQKLADNFGCNLADLSFANPEGETPFAKDRAEDSTIIRDDGFFEFGLIIDIPVQPFNRNTCGHSFIIKKGIAFSSAVGLLMAVKQDKNLFIVEVSSRSQEKIFEIDPNDDSSWIKLFDYCFDATKARFEGGVEGRISELNNNVNMENYDDNARKNIELAYAYTENNLKDRRSEIANLKLRLGTFLGFAALLLRFDLDLPNSLPFYSYTSITKIGALVTCFCSIAILVWALRPQSRGEVADPSSLTKFIRNKNFQPENAELEFELAKRYAKGCEEFYLLLDEQKFLLNLAIIGLGLNAFCVACNEILVSFFEK